MTKATPPLLAVPVREVVLARRLKKRLDKVEKQLESYVANPNREVEKAASHLLKAGGKRFRPLLVLLAAECGPKPEAPEVLTAASVVELTHLASLYHDDVMDGADLRRGAPSANAQWGNNVAILTGDLLFAKSSELTAVLGPEAVHLQATTFARLVEGQILESVPPPKGADPVKHHLDVVAGKTGALLATSARYGAMFSGASSDVVEALATYGEEIGVAFQLSDDILDIASDSDESGKTPGTDLREGVPTLPVLLAQRSATNRLAELIRRALNGGVTDDAEHAELLAELRRHPALDQARDVVKEHAAVAKKALKPVPSGAVRDALESFADSVAVRGA